MRLMPRPPALRTLVGITLGMIAGYAYYRYVGCSSGTCPISSNPWVSTGYGALLGYLATPRLDGAGRKGKHE